MRQSSRLDLRRRWRRRRQRNSVNVPARSIRTNRTWTESQVLSIHSVFGARIFSQPLAWISRFPGSRISERLGIAPRIFDGGVHVYMLRVGPCPAFDHVQRVAMRAAVFIGPHLGVFESDGINHECVAIPVP